MYVEMMSTSNGVLGKGPNRAFVMVVKLGKVGDLVFIRYPNDVNLVIRSLVFILLFLINRRW
jgi:hypothetical protein